MRQLRNRPWQCSTSLLLLAAASLLACSADPTRNPQRLDAKECAKRGGRTIGDHYCAPAAGRGGAGGRGGVGGVLGGSDGMDEAGQGDQAGQGGSDDIEHDAGPPDAGPPKACEGDATESCYDGSDATRAQPPCHAGVHTCQDGVFARECKDQLVPQPEICNGMDDDCDGTPDNGVNRALQATMATCEIANASVKGACKVGVPVCRSGAQTCYQAVFPSTEICNGIDDDCDGATDEQTETACYDGTAGCTKTNGAYTCVGQCSRGTHRCIGGKYEDACTGSIKPAELDACSPAGGDEDCDGDVDEDCTCTGSDVTTCYSGIPSTTQLTLPCKAGTSTCTNNTIGPCVGQVTPQDETCGNMGVDDNCDGTSDNIALLNTDCSAVSTAKGTCKTRATWQCMGTTLVCQPGATGIETCDGNMQDENCNGTADEGFNLQNDVANCGACGNKCQAGFACCAGMCVNTANSNLHCGSCAMACPSANTCCNSACVNLSSNGSNCGTCGHACLLGLLCGSGTCTL